ncbi:zinc-finger binding domain of transposase IS66, partial [Roseovarius lutimaris]
MSAIAKDFDLSVLPPEYRAVFEAQAARVAELEEINQRQEHLIAEMHHALYGKKSEKLADDDRQLAFEDLEVALSEVEEKKSEQASGDDKPRRKKIAKRNRGNLPEGLPRIEQVIEPDSLECPCGCGLMHRIGEDRNERLDIVP